MESHFFIIWSDMNRSQYGAVPLVRPGQGLGLVRQYLDQHLVANLELTKKKNKSYSANVKFYFFLAAAVGAYYQKHKKFCSQMEEDSCDFWHIGQRTRIFY